MIFIRTVAVIVTLVFSFLIAPPALAKETAARAYCMITECKEGSILDQKTCRCVKEKKVKLMDCALARCKEGFDLDRITCHCIRIRNGYDEVTKKTQRSQKKNIEYEEMGAKYVEPIADGVKGKIREGKTGTSNENAAKQLKQLEEPKPASGDQTKAKTP